jgi:hypothetical protein
MPTLLLKISAIRSPGSHIERGWHPKPRTQSNHAENMPDVGDKSPSAQVELDGGYWHFHQDVMKMDFGKQPSGHCRNMLNLMKSAGIR